MTTTPYLKANICEPDVEDRIRLKRTAVRRARDELIVAAIADNLLRNLIGQLF